MVCYLSNMHDAIGALQLLDKRRASHHYISYEPTSGKLCKKSNFC